VTLIVVRHAKAGVRRRWTGPDELRPLSKLGRRQAKGLIDTIVAAKGRGRLEHLVASPFVRCRQTLEPLANQLALPVELSDALAEGASLADALRLAEKFGDEHAVLCTHGDVLGELLEYYASTGIKVPDTRLEKGSVWALKLREGQVRAIRYFPAPA
jgi:8-oxo-dGTP diphosphatase